MTDAVAIDALRRDIAAVQVSVAQLTERIDRLLEAREDERAARAAIEERIVGLSRRVDAVEKHADRTDGALTVLHWLGGLIGASGGAGGAAGIYALWQQWGGG